MKEGKSTNFLRRIITAGLVLIGSELHAQNFDHWIAVTPEEFKRRKIPAEQVDSVNMRGQDAPQIDNSKVGRIFIDKANENKFYWINTHPVVDNKTKEEKSVLIESETIVIPQMITKEKLDNEVQTEKDAIEEIIKDPELISILEKFKTSFMLESPYAILGRDIKKDEFITYKKGEKVLIPVELRDQYHANGIILFDKTINKKVLILEKTSKIDSELYDLLWNMQIGLTSHAIRMTLSSAIYEHKISRKASFQEKKNFIKLYFTDLIPNSLKDLPEYQPPTVYDESFVITKRGFSISTENNTNIKIDPLEESKKIEIDDEKLDEILKEEEKKEEPK